MIRKRAFIEKGQGIVEYIMVTALVALAAVAIFKTFREDMKEAYRRAGQSLVQSVSESVSTSDGGE